MDLTTKSIEIGLPEHGDMITWDTAPPRINYALTLPVPVDRGGSPRGEVYVQFSEPVGTGDITSDITGPPGSIGPVSGPETRDTAILIPLTQAYALADLAAPSLPKFKISGVMDKAGYVEDIRSQPSSPGNLYPYLYPSPKYPVNWMYMGYVEIKGNGSTKPFVTVPSGGVRPPVKSWTVQKPGNLLKGGTAVSPSYGEDTHNVTDVLVSVPPSVQYPDSYFAWPVWAKYTEPANAANVNPGDGFWQQSPADTGIIWEFNQKKYLEERDTDLQAKLNNALSGDLGILYGFSVPGAFRGRAVSGGYGHGNPGLWLPAAGSPGFVNLSPEFYHSFARKDQPSGNNNLYVYHFDRNEPGYDHPAMLDFFFHLTGTPDDIFAARLDIAPGVSVPSNWYQLVRPFGFEIHDITLQRSGATVLNNVINPDNGESAYIHYKLVKAGQVTVQVFTMDGTMVDTLYRGRRDAGEYRAVWKGVNRSGRAVARGMYFIRIVGPDIDEIRKVMVVR
jgi:hypothetical protein